MEDNMFNLLLNTFCFITSISLLDTLFLSHLLLTFHWHSLSFSVAIPKLTLTFSTLQSWNSLIKLYSDLSITCISCHISANIYSAFLLSTDWNDLSEWHTRSPIFFKFVSQNLLSRNIISQQYITLNCFWTWHILPHIHVFACGIIFF